MPTPQEKLAESLPRDTRAYLKAVDDIHVNDAYHSLSIEGYRVSPELIERVQSGTWNPEQNPQDRENRNALAARGYYDAFVSVKASVERVLGGEGAGVVSHNDHGDWYRLLFGPSVTAGIVNAADLAGYRTDRSISGDPCMCLRGAKRCATACRPCSGFWGASRSRPFASFLGISSSSTFIPTWMETADSAAS